MMKRNKNKGFTLVELIVSMVIFGIVLAAICGFMIAGAKSYTRVNDRLTAETKLQLAANRVAESIIDCNYGIRYYEFDPNSSEKHTLFVMNVDDASAPSSYSMDIFRQRLAGKGELKVPTNRIDYAFYGSDIKVNEKGFADKVYKKDGKIVLTTNGFVQDGRIRDLLINNTEMFSISMYDVNGAKISAYGTPVYTATILMSVTIPNGDVITVEKTVSLRNHPQYMGLDLSGNNKIV